MKIFPESLKMLQSFTIKNYKNFKNAVTIDFSNVGGYKFNTDCIYDNTIGKMLIYGRNATGKTNLGAALLDIHYLLFGMQPGQGDSAFLNADSEERYAEYTYVFRIHNYLIEYSYQKDINQNLLTEQLKLDQSLIFKIDFQNHNNTIYHLEKLYSETIITSVYEDAVREADNRNEVNDIRVLPFLRWLLMNTALTADSPLIVLGTYVRYMRKLSFRFDLENRAIRQFDPFYEILAQGNNLKNFEGFLNEMGIPCRLVLKRLPDGKMELYFEHKTLVPFISNASSGTIALMNLYMSYILPVFKSSLLYLDEFDAFYHYEMADNVIRYLKEHYPKSQVIMTTHNTNLMNNRLMRPDCLMILSGSGKLTALCNATQRELREGHNLEKMYISGEFEKYE